MTLAPSPPLDTVGVILVTTSTLWVITLALFKYIITQKDKHSDKVGSDISEIKEMITFIQSNSASLKEQMSNNINELRELKTDFKETNKTLTSIRLDMEAMKEWRISADKQFATIFKELDELKKQGR